MQWSQLQKRIIERCADAVRPHIQIHSTRYGPGESASQDRAWITWDKEEIASFAGAPWLRHYMAVVRQLQAHAGRPDPATPWYETPFYQAHAQAQSITEEEGIFSRLAFHRALFESLSFSIDGALASPSPIIRAFAMLDRRLGRRRLRQITAAQLEHPLVRQFFFLRCAAERVEIRFSSDEPSS